MTDLTYHYHLDARTILAHLKTANKLLLAAYTYLDPVDIAGVDIHLEIRQHLEQHGELIPLPPVTEQERIP